MPTVEQKAKYVRSKNAGPFWITMDIFADNEADYQAIVGSPSITPEKIAELYEADASLVKIFRLPRLRIVKISVPRATPQGGKNERDMHSGQQYIPLLDIEL